MEVSIWLKAQLDEYFHHIVVFDHGELRTANLIEDQFLQGIARVQWADDCLLAVMTPAI
jgi:hypothetical protein